MQGLLTRLVALGTAGDFQISILKRDISADKELLPPILGQPYEGDLNVNKIYGWP